MAKAVEVHIIEHPRIKKSALDLLVCTSFEITPTNLNSLFPLMKRIHQMHVVPEVVPDLDPSFDFRVSFPDHQIEVVSMVAKYKFVEAGVCLLPVSS